MFLICIAIWIIFALVNYNHVSNKLYAIKEIGYLMMGFMILIILFTLKKIYTDFHAIFLKAWLAGYVINILIGYFQFFTSTQFISEFSLYALTKDANHLIHLSPASVWGNPNNFAMYLVLCMFIFYIYIAPKNVYKYYVLIIPAVFLIFMTNSRINIFLAFINLLLPLMSIASINALIEFISKHKIVILFSLIFAVYIFTFNKTIYTAVTIDNAESTSVSIRKNLISNGLMFFSENMMLGIGPGQFQEYLETGKGYHHTENIVNPHCALIEIASQYGLIILVLLIINFSYLLYYTYKHFRFHTFVKTSYCLFVLALLSNVSSGYLKSDLTWVSLFIPYLISDYLKPIDDK
jgi:teichuronic acid biosynthesis protein TuaE